MDVLISLIMVAFIDTCVKLSYFFVNFTSIQLVGKEYQHRGLRNVPNITQFLSGRCRIQIYWSIVYQFSWEKNMASVSSPNNFNYFPGFLSKIGIYDYFFILIFTTYMDC